LRIGARLDDRGCDSDRGRPGQRRGAAAAGAGPPWPRRCVGAG